RPRRVRYFGPDEAFYPRFVIAAMDVLGIERAHIAGNSMGGAVAYMTAVTAPSRTRSLVLVAPGGLGRDVAFFLRACSLPGFGLVARRIPCSRFPSPPRCTRRGPRRGSRGSGTAATCLRRSARRSSPPRPCRPSSARSKPRRPSGPELAPLKRDEDGHPPRHRGHH